MTTDIITIIAYIIFFGGAAYLTFQLIGIILGFMFNHVFPCIACIIAHVLSKFIKE